MQERVPESRHMLSIQTREEEGGGLKEDVAMVVDLVTITKISKIKIMQKMQFVEEEEETREEGGALEAEVDGNKGISNADGCWICGKIGYYANECYHNKSNDRRNGRPQQGNYASSSNNDNDVRLFVM